MFHREEAFFLTAVYISIKGTGGYVRLRRVTPA